MRKDTAVDWLITQIRNQAQNGTLDALVIMQLRKQAKAMEREQIELAFDEGLECEYEHHVNGYPRIEPSIYYNENYGGGDR